MNLPNDIQRAQYQKTRREFLRTTTKGLGALALGSLLIPEGLQGQSVPSSMLSPGAESQVSQGILKALHHAPKAKRVIYLFQSGGPSQIELFDYKPELIKRWGEEIPDSVRGEQRLTGMLAAQSSFPLVGSKFAFKQHSKTGAYFSSLVPHIEGIAEDICVINSMYTEAINHEPAIVFLQTGSQQVGRPSIGAWMSYGLGSANDNLPSFIVLLSKGKPDTQNLNLQAWGNGFLPSHHQGVRFRSGYDPVLYLSNPEGIDRKSRRRELDYLEKLEREQQAVWGDAEIDSKISQYEMAYRMQTSVPEVTDFSDEPDHIFDLYGSDSRIPGTYAANCLLARRLAERDVPFIQLYHQGWDQHGNLPNDIPKLARSSDQASAALVTDLKQRGLLEDTLVIWGGEFGRTSFSQGRLSKENYGRDHHPRCFSIWMAGGGIKSGSVYWQTENEIKDSKEINTILARYFDGDYGDDETNNKVLLPLTNTNSETSTLLLYEEENTFCSAEEIKEAYKEIEQERKVLRREKTSFEKDKKRNKADSSQRSRDDSSQDLYLSKDRFKLQDVMPLVDLPKLIDDYYPDAKVNLTATKPRCKAVWRGGDGFTVSLQRNSVGKWRFNDFKTGQSGDAYDFLVDIAGMDKSQARTEIASLVGVGLSENSSNSKHLDSPLDQVTSVRLNEQLLAAKEQSLEEEKAKQENLNKELAEWEKLSRKGKSNYLKRKGIEALTERDINIRFGKEKIDKAYINFIALKVQNSAGEGKSIQKIYDKPIAGQDGITDKKFTWGGTITGNYLVIGDTQKVKQSKQSKQSSTTIYICEGFATGASIYLALNKQVVVFCALNAHNLEPVARNLKQSYGEDISIVFAVDNDQWKVENTGLTKGRAAALKHNALIAVPSFEGLNTNNKPTDFNDLHQLANLEQVREAVEESHKVDPNLEELIEVIDLKKVKPFRHPFSGGMLSQESSLAAVKACLQEPMNEREALAILKAAYGAMND